jgi:hypothetical protein
MKRIENMTDLVTDLADVYEKLRNGTIAPKEAKEINNTAGKIINASKVQLDYMAIRNNIPRIEFLEQPEKSANGGETEQQ